MFSSNTFIISDLTQNPLTHFELMFCILFEIKIHCHSSVCGCPVFLTPFIDEIIFYPLCVFARLLKISWPMHWSVFHYYNDMSRLGTFIEKRGLFSSLFMKFKDLHVMMAFVSTIGGSSGHHLESMFLLVSLPLLIKTPDFNHEGFTLMTISNHNSLPKTPTLNTRLSVHF